MSDRRSGMQTWSLTISMGPLELAATTFVVLVPAVRCKACPFFLTVKESLKKLVLDVCSSAVWWWCGGVGWWSTCSSCTSACSPCILNPTCLCNRVVSSSLPMQDSVDAETETATWALAKNKKELRIVICE